MNKNDLIIYEFHQLDILDLTGEQQLQLTQDLISNVNIKQLEEKIHECILKLSGVGGPSFGADAVYIALDNQKRLELVHQLLYYLNIFRADVKHLKKEFRNYNYIDGEKIYDFLHYTKNLINTIYDYSEYRKKDIETQLMQLEGQKNILSYFNTVNVVQEIPESDKPDIEDLDTPEKLEKAYNDTMYGLKSTLEEVVEILKDN